MAPTKACPICCSEVTSFKKSPTTCSTLHGQIERACNECWEAHLSLEIELKDPRDIECMFCPSIINRQELKRLARDGTGLRYDLKLQDNTRHFCQNRCPESREHGLQYHSLQTNGRVFVYQFCGFETCLDCDRPEHKDETCEEYKTRVTYATKHVQDEAATREKFRMCPNCDSAFELEKGCGYVQCACGYRFCSRCLIPWAGEDSAYMGGKGAHWEGCKYRGRDSRRWGLKRRFEDLADEEEVEDEARKSKKVKVADEDED